MFMNRMEIRSKRKKREGVNGSSLSSSSMSESREGYHLPELNEDAISSNRITRNQEEKDKLYEIWRMEPHRLRLYQVQGKNIKNEIDIHYRELKIDDDQTGFLVCFKCNALITMSLFKGKYYPHQKGAGSQGHLLQHEVILPFPALQDMPNPDSINFKKAEKMWKKFITQVEREKYDGPSRFIYFIWDAREANIYNWMSFKDFCEKAVLYVGETGQGLNYRPTCHLGEGMQDVFRSNFRKFLKMKNLVAHRAFGIFNYHPLGKDVLLSGDRSWEIESFIIEALGNLTLTNGDGYTNEHSYPQGRKGPVRKWAKNPSLPSDHRKLLGSYVVWLAYNDWLNRTPFAFIES